MLGEDFSRIVNECLVRLDRGENLPDVLADFPAYQERLKPLLMIAMASRAMDVPLPDNSTHRAGRKQMLSEMDQMASRGCTHHFVGFSHIRSWFFGLVNTLRARALIETIPSYRLAVVALTIAFGVGLFAVSASASNLPGGILGSFSSDIRQVIGIFDFDQSGPVRNLPPDLIFSGADLQLDGNRAAKVAFLLDLIEDQDQSDPGSANQNKNNNQNQNNIHNQVSAGGTQGQTNGGDDVPGPGQQEADSGDPGSHPQNNPATEFAPGQQDGPAVLYAPGQRDEPTADSAPGQVKKVDAGEDVKDKEKDKHEKDKDN